METTKTETTTIPTKSEMPSFYVSLRDGLDLARQVLCYQEHIAEMYERFRAGDIDGACELASAAGTIEVEYLTLANRMLEAENAGHVLYQSGGSWKIDEEVAWKDLYNAIVNRLCDDMPEDISDFDEDAIEAMTNDYYASSVKPEDLGKYDLVISYFDHRPSPNIYDLAYAAAQADEEYGGASDEYEHWRRQLYKRVYEIAFKNISMDDDVVSDAVHNVCHGLIDMTYDDDRPHYVSDATVFANYMGNVRALTRS